MFLGLYFKGILVLNFAILSKNNEKKTRKEKIHRKLEIKEKRMIIL